MKRKGKKYKCGDYWFIRRPYKNLKENEKVKIVKVYKRKKRTITDVEDINGNKVTGVSSINLRKRPH
ncbi:MAG: hypothetical protein NC489_23385 [Ruminococcus flavefaciens]|nr:hypothetical protein [Ruminococcus flavefaciens]